MRLPCSCFGSPVNCPVCTRFKKLPNDASISLFHSVRKTFEGFFKNAADFGRSWATRLSISSSMFLSFARRESRGKNLGLLGSSMLEWPTELAKKTLPV